MDVVELTLTEESLVKVRRGYAPPPKLLSSQFADEHIIVTSGPLAGTRWQTSFAPFQRGILDVFHEPGVQTAVVMGSSQFGKTSILVNQACYRIAHDPGPMLIVFPTVEPMARDFAKNRLEPTIEATPVLRDIFGKKRAKDSSNTTLLKTFKRGFVAIGGANSAASLAARTIKDLYCDEIDRWPAELPGEGSTLAIVLKRTQAFRQRAHRFLTSSPTLENAPIHTWFLRGDQRRYYVPCPSCKEMHTFEWQNVKWTDGDPETACLECPACSYQISEAERVAVLDHGEWRAEKPNRKDKTIVSFHVWEAYSPLSSLAEIVRNFLAAYEKQKAGDKSEMHTWQNTTLAEPVAIDVGTKVDADGLLMRREDYLVADEVDVPEGACCLTLGVDTQDDRLEALVIAWGPGEESWIVDRRTFNGDPAQPEPWRELDALLDQQYLHESGVTLMIQSTCIDSAGHRTAYVYDYVHKRAARKVFAIIGRDGQRPMTSSPAQRRWGRDEREVPLYTIGVDAAKSILVSRLKLTEKGPGFIHLPHTDWCDPEFIAQLTSEKLVQRWTRGVPVHVWKKTRTRNEALDMYVYAIAALRLLNPKLPQMLENLRAKARTIPPKSSPPSVPLPPRPPRSRVGRSNYLSR